MGPLLTRAAGWSTGHEPPRVRVVAPLTAALAVLVALRVGASWLLPAHLWLVALAVVLTVTDLTRRRLPNLVVLPGGAVLAGLVTVGAFADGRPDDLLGAAAAAVILFAVFLASALAFPAGMGMGDVKLAGVLGVVLGLTGAASVLLAVLTASALHAAVSLVLLATGRAGRTSALPFGPPLLAGTAVALGWLTPLLNPLLR